VHVLFRHDGVLLRGGKERKILKMIFVIFYRDPERLRDLRSRLLERLRLFDLRSPLPLLFRSFSDLSDFRDPDRLRLSREPLRDLRRDPLRERLRDLRPRDRLRLSAELEKWRIPDMVKY